MADNIAVSQGVGTTVATDDVAGVHYQRIKLVDGTLDSTAAIPGDAANGLDVDVTRLPALAAGTNAIGTVTDSITAATGITVKAAYIASQTAATVLTPTTGKKVVIDDIVISASGAGTVYLFDNTDSATTCIGPTLSLAANGGWTFNAKKPFVSAAANNVIKYTSGAGAAGSIWIQYHEE